MHHNGTAPCFLSPPDGGRELAGIQLVVRGEHDAVLRGLRGEPCAALATPRRYDRTPCAGTHPGTETVLMSPAAVIGLVRPFALSHQLSPSDIDGGGASLERPAPPPERLVAESAPTSVGACFRAAEPDGAPRSTKAGDRRV